MASSNTGIGKITDFVIPASLMGIIAFIIIAGFIGCMANVLPTGNTCEDGAAEYMQNVAGLFLWAAGISLDFVIGELILKMGKYVGYDSASAAAFNGIQEAWRAIRDIVNIIIIGALVWTAISIILKLKQGASATQTVINILLAALLVNFSYFFAATIIDISNFVSAKIFIETFCPAGDSCGSLAGKFVEILKITSADDPEVFATSDLGGLQLLWAGFLNSIVFLVAAYVFFVAAVMLIIRFCVLVFLLVLSPIGVVAPLIPFLHSWSKQWWQTMTSNAIFPAAFFVTIAIAFKVTQSISFSILGAAGDNSPTFAALAIGGSQEMISILVVYVIGIVFLLGSLYAAKQAGAFGVDIAQSAVNSVFGGASRHTLGRFASRFQDTGLARAAATNPVYRATLGNLVNRTATAKYGADKSFQDIVGKDAKKYQDLREELGKTGPLRRRANESEADFRARQKKESELGRERQETLDLQKRGLGRVLGGLSPAAAATGAAAQKNVTDTNLKMEQGDDADKNFDPENEAMQKGLSALGLTALPPDVQNKMKDQLSELGLAVDLDDVPGELAQMNEDLFVTNRMLKTGRKQDGTKATAREMSDGQERQKKLEEGRKLLTAVASSQIDLKREQFADKIDLAKNEGDSEKVEEARAEARAFESQVRGFTSKDEKLQNWLEASKGSDLLFRRRREYNAGSPAAMATGNDASSASKTPLDDKLWPKDKPTDSKTADSATDTANPSGPDDSDDDTDTGSAAPSSPPPKPRPSGGGGAAPKSTETSGAGRAERGGPRRTDDATSKTSADKRTSTGTPETQKPSARQAPSSKEDGTVSVNDPETERIVNEVASTNSTRQRAANAQIDRELKEAEVPETLHEAVFDQKPETQDAQEILDGQVASVLGENDTPSNESQGDFDKQLDTFTNKKSADQVVFGEPKDQKPSTYPRPDEQVTTQTSRASAPQQAKPSDNDDLGVHFDPPESGTSPTPASIATPSAQPSPTQTSPAPIEVPSISVPEDIPEPQRDVFTKAVTRAEKSVVTPASDLAAFVKPGTVYDPRDNTLVKDAGALVGKAEAGTPEYETITRALLESVRENRASIGILEQAVDAVREKDGYETGTALGGIAQEQLLKGRALLEQVLRKIKEEDKEKEDSE